MSYMENITDKQITELLEKVRTLKEKSDSNPDVILEKYNFFSFLGLSYDECVFSMMIANLLKVNAAHGFGTVFLESFIKKLSIKTIPANLNFSKSKVTVEKDIGPRNDSEKEGGRIDIFIEIPDENEQYWAFIIENKIYAEDQNSQLKRYKNYANKVYPNRNFIVYLTLNGKDPSEESSNIKYKELEEHPEKQYWIQISYKDFIKEWLEDCIKTIGESNSRVKENVKQFLGQIKKLTGQDIGKMEEKEIIDLLAKDDNFAVARIIYQKYEKAKQKLAKNLFNSIKDKVAKEYPYLVLTAETKISDKNCHIDYSYEKWTDVRLSFQFEKNDFGLFKCLILGDSKDSEIKDKQIKYFLEQLPDKDEHTKFSVYRYLCEGFVENIPKWHAEKKTIFEQIDKMISAINKYYGIQ